VNRDQVAMANGSLLEVGRPVPTTKSTVRAHSVVNLFAHLQAGPAFLRSCQRCTLATSKGHASFQTLNEGCHLGLNRSIRPHCGLRNQSNGEAGVQVFELTPKDCWSLHLGSDRSSRPNETESSADWRSVGPCPRLANGQACHDAPSEYQHTLQNRTRYTNC
jgi:hypothetical protein